MAADSHADLLCVGCEMIGTNHRADEWRSLISDARKVYRGPISYNCDKYQEDQISWWDACDVISSSGYYPIEDIKQNFERIQKVTQQFDRPFMFMECGCPARSGSEYRPYDWSFNGEPDPEAQDRWYRAFTEALARHPFVRGTGWWDWPASRLYPEKAGKTNNGYCTYGKPANETLRKFAETCR